MTNAVKNKSENYEKHRLLWTSKEDQFVEIHYGQLSTQEIAQRLGRTLSAVRRRAHLLSCAKDKPVVWSRKEKAIIQRNYEKEGGVARVRELLPDRSHQAISTMALEMGLVGARNWSVDECCILERYYPTLGKKVVEKLPGRTPLSIRHKAILLGLRFIGGEQMRIWSEEEKHLLKEHLHLSSRELQQLFFPERSRQSVKSAKDKLKRKLKALQEV